MPNNTQLYSLTRALMVERRKRAKRFEDNGVEYPALLKYRCTADEDKAIDDLIIEAARCRVNYCLRIREGCDKLEPLEAAARASRIHMLRLIMHNYDECGNEEIWKRDPYAFTSLTREFQLNLAHAIIGAPEVVYRFGSIDGDYTPSTDADKRLDEYAHKHGWLAIIADGNELGDADYTVREAEILGVTKDSDDEEIRALYDSFILRLYACIAIDNFLRYRLKSDSRYADHISEYVENELTRGFGCIDGSDETNNNTCGGIQHLLQTTLHNQILETRSEKIPTRTANTERLGKALEKATEFYAIAACDAAQGYTTLGREVYMNMIDELLNDVRAAEELS